MEVGERETMAASPVRLFGHVQRYTGARVERWPWLTRGRPSTRCLVSMPCLDASTRGTDRLPAELA